MSGVYGDHVNSIGKYFVKKGLAVDMGGYAGQIPWND